MEMAVFDPPWRANVEPQTGTGYKDAYNEPT